MKTKNIFRAWSVAILTIAILLISCTEDTGSLGVFPEEDAVSTSSASFDVLSNDLLNAVVPASSTACYLGRVIDPETGEAITATFATQFHSFENYTFPDKANIIQDADGYLCDSIEIRLFLRSAFGDNNNPMKMEVWPLSMSEDKLIKESLNLYTNTNLWQFVNTEQGPIATKVFTATDYAVSDAQRASKDYTDNVRIVLSREMGENIIEKYYSNPGFFRDSYSFIRNVCPGFLFRTVSGTGTMLNLEVCTMNLNFHFKSDAYPDSIIAGTSRFAATPEVIQCTQFESSNLERLMGNEAYTMIKSPAGICTELILPIDDIYRGHESDTISRASLTLLRFNNQDKDAQDDYALDIPANLLLVRKQNVSRFFEEHQVSDSQQSFTTSFQSTYNCYTFDNLSRLIAYCQQEKRTGMEASDMTEEEWEAAHPDWNHVVVVPVIVSTANDSYGYTSQVSVNQDLSLCSTKLVRGTSANPIKMQVIYSRYATK